MLHGTRPHFLRVPEPGAAGDVSLLLSDGCRARACRYIRYIPVIEIRTMHRITTTSQNTDQDVISSSSRWSVSKMMPRTLHPFYFLLMAAYNQVRIHPANFKFHMFRTHPGFLTRLALEFIFNVPKYRVLARSGCALGLRRMRAK